MNCKHIYLPLILLICMLRVFGGDESTYDFAPTRPDRPRVLVEYHPYPEDSRFLGGIQPSPLVTTWPDERMERDVQRLSDAGIDGVLLAMTPPSLADAHHRDRLRAFLGLLEAKGMRAALLVTSPNPLKISRTNLSNYLHRMGVLNHKAWLLKDQRVVCLWAENIIPVDPAEPAEHLALLSIPQDVSPQILTEKRVLQPRDGMLWIYAAFPGVATGTSPYLGVEQMRKWELPRTKAKGFRKQLSLAFEAKPQIILISSWNNYENGSAIEPNTLDANLFSDTLRRFLQDNRPRP